MKAQEVACFASIFAFSGSFLTGLAIIGLIGFSLITSEKVDPLHLVWVLVGFMILRLVLWVALKLMGGVPSEYKAK